MRLFYGFFFRAVYFSYLLSEIFRLAAWEETVCGSSSDYEKKMKQGQELADSMRYFLLSRESCKANIWLAFYLASTRGYQWPGLKQISCLSLEYTVKMAVSALVKQKGCKGGCWFTGKRLQWWLCTKFLTDDSERR